MRKRRHLKTVKEKLDTKLENLLSTDFVTRAGNTFLFQEREIFSVDQNKISYGKIRVSQTKINPFYDAEYEVSIILSHENLKLLSSNMLNPPLGARVIHNSFRDFVDDIDQIEIGSAQNEVSNGKISIKKDLYLAITQINREEGVDKYVRVRNRILPFLKTDFGISGVEEIETERDYGLLLREILSSDELTSADVLSLTDKLEAGDDSRVVIIQEIHKQTEWLLEILRKIVDESKFTKNLAKEYGKKYFNYNKADITGPEHLMEKILTDYGKNIIFGVPALLNTDKYVISSLPRVQFDLILIDSLSDVEIVELKRPDAYLLDYDKKRNKFYPSKELAVAIGQAERYITTMYKDNDPNFKINGKSIKEFIEDEVGGTIELNVTRPCATIIIGGIHRLAKDYDDLTGKKPGNKNEYEDNMWQAYRELKNTHKNIKIITYSELIGGAELRLKST